VTTIRAYLDTDFATLVPRWHESNRTSFHHVALHQRHTLDDAKNFFQHGLLPTCQVWVAERSGTLLGMLASDGDWVKALAVFPEFKRQGVGTALLHTARAHSPNHLRLFTFQRNVEARAFYDRLGLTVVALGRSPPPEDEPDVEYRWDY
jgi:putative acetyltransferase